MKIKLGHGYYLAQGPNGNIYIRTEKDPSYCYSIAAFLASDYVPKEAKARLRQIS